MQLNLGSARDIYSLVFPILGLAVLLWGLWWTRTRINIPTKTPQGEDKLGVVEFYQDRTMMIRRRGGIDNELEHVQEAWAAFESGAHFNTMDRQRRRKIKRLILLHPDGILRKNLAIALGDNQGTFAAAIHRATDLALRDGIRVKWSQLPIANVVIANPHRFDAWARLQPYLPIKEATHWPNVVIYKSQHELAFSNIKDAYEQLWDKSEDASTSTSDKANPPP